MDFVGEIVEKEVKPPEPLSFGKSTDTSFPNISSTGGKKPSQWRSRLQKKGIASMSNSLQIKRTTGDSSKGTEYVKNPRNGLNEFVDSKDKKLNYEGLSEAERIHQENIELLSRMSVEEREREREELIGSLDPEILKMLLKRSEGKPGSDSQVDGPEGEWYGSSKREDWGKPMDEESVNNALGIEATKKKQVSFADEEDELAEEEHLMPEQSAIDQVESQTNSHLVSNVHFPKAPAAEEEDNEELDLNDPDFNEKLHEKYFPDLPKDTENLKWMQPVEKTEISEIVEDVKSLRFDFKGDLIMPLERDEIPTYFGLHHHADQPDLPGYTLSELSHYARSSFNSQRCIAVQTLGRVLHKLGLQKYNFQPVGEDGEVIDNGQDEITDKLWDLIKELKVIDTLQEFSDENVERNLSVRNYCIEALWLWRTGGGDKRNK